MQTKTQSLIESTTNTMIGFGVALATQLVVFPCFGIKVSLSDNILIGSIFTLVSILRGYLVRRLFNRMATWKTIS